MNEGEPLNSDEGPREPPPEQRGPRGDEHPGHDQPSGRREKHAPREARRRRRRGKAPAPDAPAPKKRRHRVRRWTVRSLLGLLVLLALVALALHIILQTTLPRELVIQRLQRELGLRISAESLDAGWRGHSDLGQVKLALPLAEEAFFEVPRMRVEHTNVLAMLLGLRVKIHAVALESPRLVVRQDALGRWNVAEALALVTRAGGGRSAAEDAPRESASAAGVQLPRVTLKQATLVLVDNQGRTATLPSVDFSGSPESPVSWAFTLSADDRVRVTGRVAPGQRWEHVVRIEDLRAGELLRPWVDLPQPLSIRGEWRGSRDGGGVIGRAELAESRVGDVRLSGAVAVQAGNASATLRPETLTVALPGSAGAQARIAGGELRASGSSLESRALRLALMGGTARLEGNFDWRAKAGQVNAAWTALEFPGGDGAHAGTLEATLRTPWEGRPRVDGKLTTRGTFRRGEWDAEVGVGGEGESWARMNWTAAVPRVLLGWGGRRAELRDLALRLSNDGRVLRVAEVRAGQGRHVTGAGEFDLAEKDWWLWLDLRQLAVPGVIRPVDLHVLASGDRSRIDLEDLTYTAGESTAWVGGSYVFAEPRPLDLDLYVWRIPFNVEDPGRRAIARGGLRGEAHANGIVRPMAVELSGRLIGNDVYFGKRALGDVRAVVKGLAGPERVALRSERLRLLGGAWELGGQYTYSDGSGRLDIDVDDLSLAQADQLADPPPDMAGTLEADVRVDWPRLDRDEVRVSGDWSVHGFRKAAFAAESLAGKLEVRGDELHLSDIELKQKQGRGKGRVTYNLRDRSRLNIEVAAEDWPVELPEQRGSLTVSGNATQAIDVRGRTSSGPISLSAEASIFGRDLGTAALSAEMAGKVLRISDLRGSAFGGVAGGAGTIDLENWPLSTGKLEWSGVDSKALVEMWPTLEGLQGIISGTLDVRRAQEREADEPMLAVLRVSPTLARYREMAVGDMDLTLNAGTKRLILSRSSLSIAGGRVNAWARLSEQDRARIGHTQMELEGLDVGQIARSFSKSPRAAEVNGRLEGELTMFGPPRRGYQVTGEANLRVTESGLLDIDLLEGIFRLLNPGRAEPPPRGRGRVYMRLEQGTLSIVNAFYRNEGIFVRGSGVVQDVFLGAKSAVSGQAVGTAKPLSQIKIPFILPQIDDLMATLQENFTSFRIEGAAGEPRLIATTFSEIGRELRNLVVGDVREEVQGSAGR